MAGEDKPIQGSLALFDGSRAGPVRRRHEGREAALQSAPVRCNEPVRCRAEQEIAMDVHAAVATAAGKPLEITTVQLEGPKAGEVLVEIKATGICHTDEFT